jgi:hypothetical protein
MQKGEPEGSPFLILVWYDGCRILGFFIRCAIQAASVYGWKGLFQQHDLLYLRCVGHCCPHEVNAAHTFTFLQDYSRRRLSDPRRSFASRKPELFRLLRRINKCSVWTFGDRSTGMYHVESDGLRE